TGDILQDVETALRGRIEPPEEDWREIAHTRAFFSRRPQQEGLFRVADISDETLIATWTRLVREMKRSGRSVVFLVDGLGKIPGERFLSLVPDLIRTSTLNECQSVTVVPNWSLQGWAALSRDDQVEILDIPIIEEPGFIRAVLERRAPDVFTNAALTEIARL